ncbi:MAG TPA: urate hydroxylase PuuD [Blastocatellia bacterium]|nr:urate hydroxylase PuuD [Blastocatellia bacterium]
MFPEPLLQLPHLLAQALSDGALVKEPSTTREYIEMILRWLHFIAGIVWIGHLYFFNLVNVNLMKALDGPTKGKVIPQLMPRALWWFRWGALWTVLVGLTYYAMYILAPDKNNANNLGGANANVWVIFFVWLLLPIITFAISFFLIRQINNGWVFAVVVGVLVILMSVVIVLWLYNSLTGPQGSYASNKSYTIGIGGALGIIMLLNVWGIIWPNQKRIIAWAYDNAEKGRAIPAENAKLARVAFLASRMNTWLSIPMLFFMAASSHFNFIGR